MHEIEVYFLDTSDPAFLKDGASVPLGDVGELLTAPLQELKSSSERFMGEFVVPKQLRTEEGLEHPRPAEPNESKRYDIVAIRAHRTVTEMEGLTFDHGSVLSR